MIIQPPSVLLTGPTGSGKTSAIPTQLLCGLNVFVIVTEPDGVASLIDACDRLKAPIDNLHWSFCPPASAGWKSLIDMADKISAMDQGQLAAQRDMGKSSFRDPALKLIRSFENFICDRTGTNFGDVTSWDDTCSLNIDSLTGVSAIGFGATVGYKPTAAPGEWGIAQNFVFNLLSKVHSDRRCFFNLTAHIEKEMDEISGVRKVMVSTIGAKLAPKIPPFFSEVVKCSRLITNGQASFTWSTLDSSQDLKNRALPISVSMPADFKPVIEAYRRRVSAVKAAGTVSSPVPKSAPASPNAKVMPTAPLTPATAT